MVIFRFNNYPFSTLNSPLAMFIPVTLFERYLFRRLSESALAKLDDEILYCCTDYLTEEIQKAQRTTKEDNKYLEEELEELSEKFDNLRYEYRKLKKERDDFKDRHHALVEMIAALRSKADLQRRPKRLRN
jgi:FtsZ-binding cell division protein ZapB